MRYENNELTISEGDFMVNLFFQGVTLELLEQHTGRSKEWWKETIRKGIRSVNRGKKKK